MASRGEFMRYASPNERRVITREDLGFYHAVIIGATYELPLHSNSLYPWVFFHGLQSCIQENPFLSVIVQDSHTDKAYFQRVPSINLEDHVYIVRMADVTADNDLKKIEKVLVSHLDQPFPRGTPPWKVLVLPLEHEVFIAFAFSHAIGDGPTGLAFHHTFLRSSNGFGTPSPSVIIPPIQALPPPFDTPGRLPISWGYLLSPLLSVLLPSFMARLFGLRTQAFTTDVWTWTGAQTAYSAESTRTKLKVREIKPEVVEGVLRSARYHDAKFTGTLSEIIVEALGSALRDLSITNFVSLTVVNMRGAIGIHKEACGNYISGHYTRHTRSSSSEPFAWTAASEATKTLAAAAVTLQNQPIGLLRYVPSIRDWTLGKLGQQRDCSFEVSNLGIFVHDHESDEMKIGRVVFAQPGHVTSSPMAFNVVSVKGGAMIYTVSWPTGALGVAKDQEDDFVEEVCNTIENRLAAVR